MLWLPAIAQMRVAFVFNLLTFCPPGPELRAKRNLNSRSGICSFSLMRSMNGPFPQQNVAKRAVSASFILSVFILSADEDSRAQPGLVGRLRHQHQCDDRQRHLRAARTRRCPDRTFRLAGLPPRRLDGPACGTLQIGAGDRHARVGRYLCLRGSSLRSLGRLHRGSWALGILAPQERLRPHGFWRLSGRDMASGSANDRALSPCSHPRLERAWREEGRAGADRRGGYQPCRALADRCRQSPEFFVTAFRAFLHGRSIRFSGSDGTRLRVLCRRHQRRSGCRGGQESRQEPAGRYVALALRRGVALCACSFRTGRCSSPG